MEINEDLYDPQAVIQIRAVDRNVLLCALVVMTDPFATFNIARNCMALHLVQDVYLT